MIKFENSGLKPEILSALKELNFIEPTPIQKKTIPHLLTSKQNLIASAQTGTGKTAAFSLPIIQQIDVNDRNTQAMILCPTRELCLQITKDIHNFSKHLAKIDTVAIYGGDSIDKQINLLKKGAQIVVGTPGRVNDLMDRKKLNISAIKWLVLDEADEILDMGFKDDLDAILERTPDSKQTLLFSATMQKGIMEIARKHIKDAHRISMGDQNISAENITHEFYITHAKDRFDALVRILDSNPDIYGILFCRTRQETQEVADKLKQFKYNAEALHGDVSQNMRTQIMSHFKRKNIKLLVATDVAARGIDVNNLSHVINFSLPDSPRTYIHRSGRTGRASQSGISISILNMKEMRKIQLIEKIVGKRFTQKKIPLGTEICEKQLYNFVDKIKNIDLNETQITQYLPPIMEKLKDMTREEVIKRFISIELHQILSHYKNSADLNSNIHDHEKEIGYNKGKSKRDNRGVSFAAFTINLGKKHRFNHKLFFELITMHPRLRKVRIGDIRIGENSTYFEIDESYDRETMKCMNNMRFKGTEIITNPARQ
ncbi:DEAD/DEAH box helicase [Candidatus Peregrinibacteria bacterium RIFOXYC2_FULL_33_13]|nr:MAG: ATP-dependent RNA helicase [Candidatus Peregrinibacteria bacterium GW2011_GWA2_33_10]KKP39263.1 MAG: dead/deah box helicase domain protein, ATP-dependent RNA helicase DeaD [Candidatus Peregrinibacteria bacterium GW2011_GWC2_33_13]OGJ49872.1 MAG: DEAD/DEAH box helicase [Candidatus Peregrinibacteria bacterium RIFOXYA2_FULL_33_7]OGJ54168.1 MAG: DEAD/DEAH box helicase [Candidatus Peregrinibacteria bacterium RIFOXYC2_FULL_33_13]